MNFYRILFKFFSILKIDKNDYLSNQIQFFKKYKYDYNLAKENLEKIIGDLDLTKYHMNSEHLKIFSAISLNHKVKNILERGTYDGFNSLILSKLFPNSNIQTIDLDENNKDFNKIYNRENLDIKNQILKIRDNNLKKSKNIKFSKLNSLNLTFENKKYDLIWIDGFHGAPTVISDIINSLRLLDYDGIILIDDIYEYGLAFDPYQSNAANKTLEFLKNASIINYDLFYKRLEKKFNRNKYDKKYIAMVKNVK